MQGLAQQPFCRSSNGCITEDMSSKSSSQVWLEHPESQHRRQAEDPWEFKARRKTDHHLPADSSSGSNLTSMVTLLGMVVHFSSQMLFYKVLKSGKKAV